MAQVPHLFRGAYARWASDLRRSTNREGPPFARGRASSVRRDGGLSSLYADMRRTEEKVYEVVPRVAAASSPQLIPGGNWIAGTVGSFPRLSQRELNSRIENKSSIASDTVSVAQLSDSA